MSIKNIYIYTLGCRLNQTESEAIAESFKNNSFNIVNKQEEADLSIINSCTVTSKAQQKMRREAKLFSSFSICITTGCAIKENFIKDEVIYIKLDDKFKLLKLANFINNNKQLLDNKTEKENIALIFDFLSKKEISNNSVKAEFNSNSFLFFPTKFQNHQRASLKIQDGCNKYCSFCAVSIARGEPRSLELEEVLKRFNKLQELNYKEITLTGVNLALYKDEKNNTLANVLSELSNICKNDVKVRLSSLEPDLITDNLIDYLRYDFVAPYFHLPIQSASDKVIKLTGRKYNAKILSNLIDKLRVIKKNPFIGADIIVGLPAEDNTEFNKTYNFLKDKELSFIHVFPFSKREGTKFYQESCPPQRERDENCKKLRELSSQLYFNYAKKFQNAELEAIFEEVKNQTSYFTADNYLKLECPKDGNFSQQNLTAGERYKLKIIDIYKNKDNDTTIKAEVINKLSTN